MKIKDVTSIYLTNNYFKIFEGYLSCFLSINMRSMKKTTLLNTQLIYFLLKTINVNRCFKKKLPNLNRKHYCW